MDQLPIQAHSVKNPAAYFVAELQKRYPFLTGDNHPSATQASRHAPVPSLRPEYRRPSPCSVGWMWEQESSLDSTNEAALRAAVSPPTGFFLNSRQTCHLALPTIPSPIRTEYFIPTVAPAFAAVFTSCLAVEQSIFIYSRISGLAVKPASARR